MHEEQLVPCRLVKQQKKQKHNLIHGASRGEHPAVLLLAAQDVTPFGELFALAFRIIDHEWKARGATRKDFGPIMASTKQTIVDLLETGPASIDEVMERALRAGVPR